MTKGARVRFTWGVGKTGYGKVISEEEDGHVLVSVDPTNGEERHFVIHCATTWLTEIA